MNQALTQIAGTEYMESLRNPMNRERVIVHSLDGTWQTEAQFPAIEYSKFKYGSGQIARKFGEELADKFVASNFFDTFVGDGNDIVMTASPYKYIAPAASAIKKYFTNRLNSYLSHYGMNSANMVRMTRSVLFEGDYGTLTEEGRTSLLKKDRLTIDRDFVKGKILLVLDDIKITGAHEEKIVNMFLEEGIEPRQVVFLYMAELQNPEQVGADYENYLNHFFVKSLETLLPIINEQGFILNARVCKYLLSQPNGIELRSFLHAAGETFMYELIAACIGDGYDKMDSYQYNFNVIKQSWLNYKHTYLHDSNDSILI